MGAVHAGGTESARRYHGRSLRGATVILVAALAATCGGPPPPPTPSPTGGPPTPSPTGSAAVTPLPTPDASAGTDAWAALNLPPLAQVARLEATRAAPAGAALDTAFRLTSLDGRDPAELASRLVTQPQLALTVGASSGSTVVLRPKSPLRQGQLYRVTLRGVDGVVEGAWAVQAVKPLHVVTTIPGDESTSVPVDTGIEFTFDQDGVTVADVQRFFAIAPATPGRFELHGRTVAFVPDEPLRKATLYTVTVRHGLPLPGTSMTLEADAIVRFETAATSQPKAHVTIDRPMYDANPREHAGLAVRIDVAEDEEGNRLAPIPERVEVAVHRLPDLAAAVAAYRLIVASPEWTTVSTTAPVATGDLPRVISGTLRLRTFDAENDWLKWFQLPRTLRAGWYVVTVAFEGIPRQSVLQVTDLATFALVSETRTATWVNDLRTGGPVRGASITLAGATLGRTDADGLLVVKTPARAAAPTDGSTIAVVVRQGSRSAFVPVDSDTLCGKCEMQSSAPDRWWRLFSPDRYRYRSTDTINAWGVVRDRDDRSVPDKVSVRLLAASEDGTRSGAIASKDATPDRNGAFTVALAFSDLPVGVYTLELRVGGRLVAERGLEVGPIVKPAWQMTMSTDRHAVRTGQRVTAAVQAAFFEGTPVAGAEIGLEATGGEATVTTGVDGSGSASLRLLLDAEAQWDQVWVQARPTLPEEAEIDSGAYVAVFRADALLRTAATLDGTRLLVTGEVNDVAWSRFEAPGASVTDVDPYGGPRANATVRLRIVEHIPVITKVGTAYDFITKRVEPVYEVTERTVNLGTRTVHTDAKGTYRLSMTVAGGTHGYQVFGSYADQAGRTVQTDEWASGRYVEESETQPRLEATDPNDSGYAIGESIRLAFAGGAGDTPASRYLYAVSQRGLRSVTLSANPRFATRFTEASVPGIWITGVRFNGSGYEAAWGDYFAMYRTADRRLTVSVTPDAARYEPGDRASVTIRTTNAAGRAVSASVFLRVIDEKLYAIGAAEDADPLDELYESVDSGIVAEAWSHRSPAPPHGGEGGDTTGGGGDEGGRSDFRDWLVARLVTTGADGTARVAFDLSDDLTSWRAVASAVDRSLEAGIGTGKLAVGLPFFVEPTIAPEYLAADRPIIRMRAFGAGLAPSATVTYAVSSDTLPMASTKATARVFEAAEVALPALKPGVHRIRIAATTGSGTSRREDVITRTFRVVETRVLQGNTASRPLTAGMTVQGGAGFTTVTLADGGRGRVVPILDALVWADPGRADRAIASVLAADVLGTTFGRTGELPTVDTDLGRFQQEDGGISLLPYSSADLELSVLAALSGDARIDRSALHMYFSDQVAETRERGLLALAGRAALGDPVLADIRSAAAITDLTPSERITVALAAFAAGDEALAATIERALLAEHGQRLGPWVRLSLGGDDLDSVATARLAIVAASLGDAVAAGMDAFVETHPPRDTVVELERAIAARGWAARVPGTAAVAALTRDGVREEVRISPDSPVRLELTPAQVAGLRLDPVSGSVVVGTSWESGLDESSLSPADGQKLARAVSPSGQIGSAQTVFVTFSVTLGPKADDGCWRLTDFAPSGLAPIAGRGYEYDEEGEPYADGPYLITGQRVDFCVSPDPLRPTQTLRYLARVVTPGAYRWEPAVLQSSIVREQGIVLPAFDVTITGLGA